MSLSGYEITVQMATGANVTGSLPAPGVAGGSVSVTNGVATVPAVWVPLAIRAGWTVMQGEAWPEKSVRHLSVPIASFWAGIAGGVPNSSMAFPDGTSSYILGPVGSVKNLVAGS